MASLGFLIPEYLAHLVFPNGVVQVMGPMHVLSLLSPIPHPPLIQHPTRSQSIEEKKLKLYLLYMGRLDYFTRRLVQFFCNNSSA